METKEVYLFIHLSLHRSCSKLK